MLIRVNYKQNTFIGLESQNFTIFEQNIYFLNFWKGKLFKSPTMIRSHDTFVVTALTHRSTPLGNNVGKENNY